MPGFNRPSRNGPRADPLEPFHLVADRREHQTNLPFQPLAQDDLEFLRAELVDGFRLRADALRRLALLAAVHRDGHPGHELRRQRHVERPVEQDFVFLVDLVPRMGQLQREFAVVGEQKQPLAVLIQTPDMENTREIRRQQVEHRVTLARVRARGKEARRFVQHDVHRLLDLDGPVIDLDGILRPDVRGQRRDDVAVDGNAPRRDDQLHTPGAIPARRRPDSG